MCERWLCVSVLRSSVWVVSREMRSPSKSLARALFRYIPLQDAGSVLLCPLYVGCRRESCQSEGWVWNSHRPLKKMRMSPWKSVSPACSIRLVIPEGPGDLFGCNVRNVPTLHCWKNIDKYCNCLLYSCAYVCSVLVWKHMVNPRKCMCDSKYENTWGYSKINVFNKISNLNCYESLTIDWKMAIDFPIRPSFFVNTRAFVGTVMYRVVYLFLPDQDIIWRMPTQTWESISQ